MTKQRKYVVKTQGQYFAGSSGYIPFSCDDISKAKRLTHSEAQTVKRNLDEMFKTPATIEVAQ